VKRDDDARRRAKAFNGAKKLLPPILELINQFEIANPRRVRGDASDYDPVRVNFKRMWLAAAFINRDYGGEYDGGSAKEIVQAAVRAKRLLMNWSPRTVGKLIKDIDIGAELYVTREGGVDVGSNYSAGTLEQLVALSLGYARQSLKEAGPKVWVVKTVATERDRYKKGGQRGGGDWISASKVRTGNFWGSRVKRCENPGCLKWFLDLSPGANQKDCCNSCANDHGSKAQSPDYVARRKMSRGHAPYALKPCCRC